MRESVETINTNPPKCNAIGWEKLGLFEILHFKLLGSKTIPPLSYFLLFLTPTFGTTKLLKKTWSYTPLLSQLRLNT